MEQWLAATVRPGVSHIEGAGVTRGFMAHQTTPGMEGRGIKERFWSDLHFSDTGI